ncbi:MAG: DUF4105 domain-containing protein [Caulobacterales bacterium]
MDTHRIGRAVRWAAILAGLALLAVIALSMTAKPRTDRDWYPYLARESHVSLTAGSFKVAPVSDWTYDSKQPLTKDYGAAEYRFADLRNVWFVLEPQPDMTIAAHTFLLFEFAGDRLLGITIEARREANEEYSPLLGAFNAYELSYLWATSRDLLTRRAVMLRHQTFIYPLTVDDETEQQLLRALLERTEKLESQPRFYNTLFSNCTNELAKATKLKWDASFIFTGTSAKHLFKMGVIPGKSFAAARVRADMTDVVKSLNGTPDNAAFDAAVLAELRKRTG